MIVTLKDGSKKEYAEAKSVIDIAYDISEGLARAACAGEVNGEVAVSYTHLDVYKRQAKRAASSPPAPARISTITFLLSLGSFGRRRILSSCSSSSTFFFACLLYTSLLDQLFQ